MRPTAPVCARLWWTTPVSWPSSWADRPTFACWYASPTAIGQPKAISRPSLGPPRPRHAPWWGGARSGGVAVVGFSFHVGSQLDGVAPFVAALTQTLALVDEVDAWGGPPLEVVDLGGGFPVGYRHDAVSIEEIGQALQPMLESRRGTLRFVAELGRYLVAESTVLATSVIGASERGGVPWYFLDDGVYGSYSNVICEDVHPVIVAAKERSLGGAEGSQALERVTLAGPTCDSVDVVARNYPLPQLAIGDLLLSPTMGAYTSVTATDFNGVPRTPIIAVSRRARAGLSTTRTGP